MFEFFRSFKNGAVDETVEKTEEELKAERIKFHREHIRTGPKKFVSITAGDVRRRRVLDAKSQARKATKRARRRFFEEQRELAVLRARLQAAGAFRYEHGGSADPWAKREAIVALIAQYGDRDPKTGEPIIADNTVDKSVVAAIADYQRRVAA